MSYVPFTSFLSYRVYTLLLLLPVLNQSNPPKEIKPQTRGEPRLHQLQTEDENIHVFGPTGPSAICLQVPKPDLKHSHESMDFSGETGSSVSPQNHVLIYIETEAYRIALLVLVTCTIRKQKKSLCSSGPSVLALNLASAHWDRWIYMRWFLLESRFGEIIDSSDPDFAHTVISISLWFRHRLWIIT